MATACLDRIRQDDELPGLCEKHGNCHLKRTVVNKSFLRHSSFGSFSGYAAVYWPEHARLSGNNLEELFAAAPAFFAKESYLRDRWWSDVRMLFERYPSDDVVSPDDMPALHMACCLGVAPWVTKLFRSKLGFLLTTRQNRSHGVEGLTPLMHAASVGHATVVDQLLCNHAKNESQDRVGRTALCHAVLNAHVGVTQRLLNQGADVVAKDRNGYSALHQAAHTNNVVLMHLLLEHSNNPASGSNGFRHLLEDTCTLLHVAAERGHVDVMEYLLDKGAKVDSRDARQQTPLHRAVFEGRVEASRLLAQRGATIDARFASGMTLLHGAVMGFGRSEELSRILLTAGANVNAR